MEKLNLKMKTADATESCLCGEVEYQIKGSKVIIVSVGTLDARPGIEAIQSIFCGSKAEWYKASSELPEYTELPVKGL